MSENTIHKSIFHIAILRVDNWYLFLKVLADIILILRQKNLRKNNGEMMK